jgi:hydrogenase-4 component B
VRVAQDVLPPSWIEIHRVTAIFGYLRYKRIRPGVSERYHSTPAVQAGVSADTLLTAITALIASLAISGVPLLNGFVSKWMLFVAGIEGAHFAPYLALFAAIGILVSAATLASFIKFFGTAFLSRSSALVQVKAREAESRQRTVEVGWTMQLPQLSLATLCVSLGLMPGIAVTFLQHAFAASREGLGIVLADAKPKPMSSFPFAGLAIGSSAMLAPLAVTAVLGATLLVAYGISRLGSAPRRKAEPWLCAYAREADSNRYSAHHFYPELKRSVRWLGGSPRSRPVQR